MILNSVQTFRGLNCPDDDGKRFYSLYLVRIMHYVTVWIELRHARTAKELSFENIKIEKQIVSFLASLANSN